MKTVLLKNSKPNGTVVVPPSKSAAHRALFCSFWQAAAMCRRL